MPLSEYHRPTAKDKPEATQSRKNNCSSDLFSMPDHEFSELVWENGQVVMQGHSSRPKRSSFPTSFSSHAAGVEDKDSRDAIDLKTSMNPMVNDFLPSGPSAHGGVNAQDDDMVPWIDYPTEEPLADDALQNEYCLEFLNEFMGANLNSHPACSKPMPTDRSSGVGQHASKALTESKSSEPSRVRTSQLFQLSQHYQSSAPSSKSGEMDKGIGDGGKTHLQSKNPAGPKPLQLNGNGMLNFSHFSRPTMLGKANLHGADRPKSNEVSTSSNSNLVESTLIDSTTAFKSATGVRGRSTSGSPKMELRFPAKPPQEVFSVEHSEAICQQDVSRKNNGNILANNCSKPPDQLASSSAMASVALRGQETEKVPEAVVASSSVCSANSAGATSNDPKEREKRKSREGEESGYQSDDFEDVSVELKKPATGRGTSVKRSHAAEVHNLSERRRRDRINEKMRALQELIPNCNKVDKASMLEEAIEYLKTLQMQVQIMSMNSGLCMPPMLLPPGMQHIHAPAIARFLPGVGMGMGMGFGYGMGMYDMNGSPSCSMIPAPPFGGPQFPCPSIPGPLGLHGMPGSVKHHMFGVPGQGIPLSLPRPSSSGLSVKANSVPEITAPMTCAIPASDAAPASISADQQHQNIDTLQRSDINNSQMQNPNQEVKEPFEQ